MADTILRLDPRERAPAFLMARETAQDERLTWEATGLLTYLHSLPPDWTVRTADLVKRRRGGRERMLRILRELREAGYLDRQQERAPDGTVIRWVYLVRMCPQSGLPLAANPEAANPTAYRKDSGRQTVNSSQKRQGEPELRSVFDAWRAATGRNGTTALDRKRTRAIRDRFGDGFSVEQLVLAVQQIPRSDFHAGRHDKTKGSSEAQLRRLSELTLHLRDADHVEYLLALAPSSDVERQHEPRPGHVWSDEELLKGGD